VAACGYGYHPISAMPPNIGLCIAGKAALREWRSTAALDARVVESQLEHLVPSLRHQGSLDVIFVLDSTDAADAEVQQILTRFQPLTVRYDNSSADAVDGRRRRTVPSYMKLAVCADAFERAEQRRGIRYDWTVRSRPDLYFYGALPTLSSLDVGAVHSRVRCHHFKGSFIESQISSENHHRLRRDCSHRPTKCPCRQMPDCPDNATLRLDDQFAIVPRALMHSYFASHEASVHSDLSAVTHDFCPPLLCTADACRCTQGIRCHARPECMLTNSVLVRARARVVPTALHFTIARTRNAKWGAGRRLGRLFLDAVLINGSMDAQAARRYRQVEGCGSAPLP